MTSEDQHSLIMYFMLKMGRPHHPCKDKVPNAKKNHGSPHYQDMIDSMESLEGRKVNILYDEDDRGRRI